MNGSTDALAALERSPLFAGLGREDLEEIVQAGRPVSFGAGEVLVERGDPGDAMYIVLSGTAEVDVGGRSHRLKEGEFLGEMAVMGDKKRMATVRAADDVEALRISADDFEAILLRRPRIAVTILKRMVERLREVQNRVDAWIGVW